MKILYCSGINPASLQLKERKEVTLQVTTVPDKVKPVIAIERYSNYMHLLRVTTWVFCVVTCSYLFSSTSLSVAEFSKAKTWLFKQAQAKMFLEVVEALQKGKPLPLPNWLQLLNTTILLVHAELYASAHVDVWHVSTPLQRLSCNSWVKYQLHIFFQALLMKGFQLTMQDFWFWRSEHAKTTLMQGLWSHVCIPSNQTL